MSSFELHPQLAADTFEIGRLNLSRVLLMNDARYPWVILVPERPGLIEFLQLSLDDCATLVRELRRACAGMLELFRPDKLNIAALGNMVPQFHVHVIARFRADPSWPRPVWTAEAAPPYAPDVAVARLQALRGALRLSG
jgi:diadenosine tetraphosphate (Ap4A) HIT family hydrolase